MKDEKDRPRYLCKRSWYPAGSPLGSFPLGKAIWLESLVTVSRVLGREPDNRL